MSMAPPTPPPPRLGIGVTTFERRERLEQVLDGLTTHTRTPHRLLIADDGSSDAVVPFLRERRIPHIAAPNRGVAWNKNRLLFHLAVLERCDVVLLLEDDTVPSADGWESPWLECAARYGHMNYAGPWMLDHMTSGAGTAADPYRSPLCSGQCVVFSREAIGAAGFMDTRFGRYGYEHGEHTERMRRAGFGGDPATGEILLIESDIVVYEGGTSRFDAVRDDNAPIFDRVRLEPSVFRPAFRSPRQFARLFGEMWSARLYDPRRTREARARLASPGAVWRAARPHA